MKNLDSEPDGLDGMDIEGNFQKFIELFSDKQLEECLRLLIPIIKLDQNKYMVGTAIKQIQMKNNNLIIKVGGGYETLTKYLKTNSKL